MRPHRGPLARRASAAAAALALVVLGAPGASRATDLDALMARVIERRDENWRRLHEYVLSERERLDVRDPEDRVLHGGRREFVWYIRDGYFVRSPVRFNGVAIGEADRHAYEARWLDEEVERARRAAREQVEEERAARDPEPGDDAEPADPEAGVEALVGQGVEPRFISHAYFLDFEFEPGNYYLVGREALEGRHVLRVEYYPTRLFGEAGGADDAGDEPAAPKTRTGEREAEEMVRKLNRVALITLWVDPAEEQIVKYTFDNTGYEFFPLRWLLRVDDVSASMVMAPLLQGFWVPRTITARASFTVAAGTYEVDYAREFSDYQQAETRARMRGVVER